LAATAVVASRPVSFMVMVLVLIASKPGGVACCLGQAEGYGLLDGYVVSFFDLNYTGGCAIRRRCTDFRQALSQVIPGVVV
jgi:hypothetical protein